MPGGSGVLALGLAEPGSRTGRWTDLRLRTLSAAALAPVALVCGWIGGLPFTALIGAGALGLTVEWTRLSHRNIAPLWLVFTGFLWIGMAGAALLWLRALAGGQGAVITLMVVVWATDITAYVMGRAVGGPRLAPRISPGKTWSGAACGLAAAVLTSLVASLAFGLAQPPAAAVGGALLGIAAQIGDFAESAIKRRLGVKDSGGLIPGHGGLFDRLDGLMAAAPLAALLALLTERGVLLMG